MAKRKTIGENPLDAIAPDRTARQKKETVAATNPRPAVAVSPAEPRRPAKTAPAAVNPEKGTATSIIQATRTQAPARQTPAQQDLLRRIKSLEEQNTLMKWLVYGAIGLAFLL
jgi:hypothetical protein